MIVYPAIDAPEVRSGRALRAVRRVLLAALAVIAVCIVYGQDFSFGSGQTLKFGHAPEQYLYFAAFLLFISWALGQRMALKFTGRDILVLSFLAYFLLSWFWAYYDKGWAEGRENLCFAVLAYIILKFSLREEKWFGVIAGALIYGAVIFSICWHIAGFYGVLDNGGYFKTHYNAFAFSMEAPLLLAFVIAFASNVRLPWRILAALSAAVIASSFIYVPSRGGLIGLLAAVVFLAIVLTRRWKYIAAVGLLVVLGVVVVSLVGSADDKKRGIARGVGGRSDTWSWALKYSLERPILGWGARSWPLQRYETRKETDPVLVGYEFMVWYPLWNHAHNEALQMWFSFGLVGLVFMAVFLAAILILGAYNARSKIPDLLKAINFGVLAWVVCHYFHGIFDAGFSGNAKQHLIAIFMVSMLFQIYDVYARRQVPAFAWPYDGRMFFSMPVSVHNIGPVEAMKNVEIPKSVMKRLLDPREYEGAYIVGELVGDRKKVLSIGGCYGRDYYYLTARGKEVVCFDLAPQEHLPDLVIGDITKKTDFRDGEFDAVIMGDIIEHLFEDVDALKEVRRILKDDGVLVMSVPFVNDEPEFHVRVHTEKSVRRLLAYAGFKVTDYAARGGRITNVSFWKRVRSLSVMFSKDKQAAKIRFNERLAGKDFRDGRKNPPAWALSKYYGGYFRCTKGREVDTREINVEAFAH
ncbi:MAG: O-antigen ligase family protein [Planctomycetota bacterium]|jgi:O-antigen ligase